MVPTQSNEKRKVYSTNGAGTHGYPFGKKQPWYQPYIIDTINFKWITVLKIKTKTIKLLKKKQKQTQETVRETYFEKRQKIFKTQKAIIMHEKMISYGTSKLKSSAHQKTMLSK